MDTTEQPERPQTELEKRYAEFRATVPLPAPDVMNHSRRNEREHTPVKAATEVDLQERRREGWHNGSQRWASGVRDKIYYCPLCKGGPFAVHGIKIHRCPKLSGARLSAKDIAKVTES